MAAAPTTVGPYEILGELGRGGMGVVYRARRPGLPREFALKVILQGEDASAEAVLRFRREAEAAAQLADHPGIVGVHDIGEEHGRVYFAMDLVEGHSLDELLLREEIDLPDAARIIAQAAHAVQHAHDHGILHRDLKPGNILVTRPRPGSSGQQSAARVTDFGLAKSQDADHETARLTKSGTILGTPAYMPPEQAAHGALDGRADVYALGATLHEALVGRPPFDADTMYALLAKIQREEVGSLRAIAPHVPAELDVVTRKCLEKNPERRYQTAAGLAADLERWLRGEPILARPPSLRRRVQRTLARRAGLYGALAAGVLGLGGTAAVLVPSLLSEREEAATAREDRAAAESAARQAREQALVAMREQAQTSLDAGLELRRAGRPDRAAKFFAKVAAACRSVLDRVTDSPEPYYWLARMHRAAARDDAAADAVAKALAIDPAHGPTLYERVVLANRAYRRQLERRSAATFESVADLDADSELTPDRPGGAERAELDAAVAALEEAAAGVAPGQLACARGLRAWLDGDPATARRELERAVAADPTLEEAYEVLASIETDAGRWEAAESWWSKGIALDAGYPPYFEGRGRVRTRRAAKGGGAALWAQAVADFDAALALDPDRPSSLAGRGAARMGLANATPSARALELGRRAVADLARAHELAPQDVGVARELARGRVDLGQIETKQGGTPLPVLKRAIAGLTALIGELPDDADLWQLRGLAHLRVGGARAFEAVEALADYRAALADLDAALERRAGLSTAQFHHAAANAELGRRIGRTGEPADPWFERSLADYDALLRPGVNEYVVRKARGTFFRLWREARVAAGADPGDLFQRCEDEWSRVVRFTAAGAADWFQRGYNRFHWGVHAQQSKTGNPITGFNGAIQDMTEVLKRQPGSGNAYLVRAGCRLNVAKYLQDRGEDPIADWRACIQDCDAMLKGKIANKSAVEFRGKAFYGWFQRLQAAGKPAHLPAKGTLESFTALATKWPEWKPKVAKAIAEVHAYLAEHPQGG